MSRKRRKKTRTKPPRQKKPLTAAARRQRRKRRRDTMIIFINGKQKRVPRPRPELTERELLPFGYDEYWIIQNGLFEYYRPPPGSDHQPADDPTELFDPWDFVEEEVEPESFGIQFTWEEYSSQLRSKLSSQEIPF